MYNLISSLRPLSLENIKRGYEDDVGEMITDDVREVILRQVYSTSAADWA